MNSARLLAPLLWLSLALVAGGIALRFPSAPPGQSLGPAAMPLLLSASLAGLALLSLLMDRGRPRPAAGGARRIAMDSPVVLVALCCAYLLLLPRLGFISSSALLVTVALRLFGYAGTPRALAIGLGLGFALHLVFSRLMGVPLPAGLLG